MSKFTHLLCEKCWNSRNPERQVADIPGPTDNGEPCCGCLALTESGIYVRGEPAAFACNGQGGPHLDD